MRVVSARFINVLYVLCVISEDGVRVVSACCINLFYACCIFHVFFSKEKKHLITGRRKLEEQWLGLGLVLALFLCCIYLCCILISFWNSLESQRGRAV